MCKLITTIIFLLFTITWNVFSQDDHGSERQRIEENIQPDEIQKRIEDNRMGEITIVAKPGETIIVKQKKHEFLFGTAIPNIVASCDEMAISDKEREQYLKILSENFNYAVHENALKWYTNEPKKGAVSYDVADEIWELCNERDIPMRGHCVYWEKEEFLMDWLVQLPNDSLRLAVKNRTESLIPHYKGRINEYDLNNEMIHGDFFRRRLGSGIVNEMAWMVKSYDPDVKLYLNDYGILDAGYNVGAYLHQIKLMQETGVPIDGIGCQAHRSTYYSIKNTPYHVQRTLDRLSVFGLPIKITEALFYGDEETQAEELTKLLPIYFAHPNVEAIVFWGFWEKGHWVPHTAMWRTDFTPTKQAEAYRELVYSKWWTNTQVQAGKNGKATVKAFYGDYEISVNNEIKNISLKKTDGNTTITFE